jgi:ribosome-associated translation inhibitor RaiA
MDITISFRHIDPNDEIKSYVEEKLKRLQKYIETLLTSMSCFPLKESIDTEWM